MSSDQWKFKKFGLLVLVCFIANGCGNQKKKEAENFDIVQSVYANGCLNLENFYGALQNLPESGIVRTFTYDFSTAEKEQNGSQPTASRLRVLNRAAYFYSESNPAEIYSTWTRAHQTDCSSGELLDSYGNATPFRVESYRDNWIAVKLSDESTHRFELNDNSLRIISTEMRGSQCIYHSPLQTKTQTMMRWGPSGELPNSEELSTSYMRMLSESVYEAPAALRTSVANVTSNSLSLSVALLRDMNSMEVNVRDQNDCPNKSKAPEAEPLPTPAPTPVPTPVPEATPDPSATPVEMPPSPETEPQPTPEI